LQHTALEEKLHNEKSIHQTNGTRVSHSADFEELGYNYFDSITY